MPRWLQLLQQPNAAYPENIAMSKTPAPTATPQRTTVDNADPVDALVYPDPDEDPIQQDYWRATRFADALLANPRCDQLLRLHNLTPGALGADLARACWHMAKSFNWTLDNLKEAAIDEEKNQ
jgi:hypothetical protein